MYRNKMMVIATLFVVGLLGVMIWSSNVVADNHAQQKQVSEEETDIMSGDFAKEHLNSEEASEESDEEVSDSQEPSVSEEKASEKKGIYIDTSDIEPPMTKRYVPSSRVKSNYLEQFYGDKLVLWNKSDFPLSVYIKDSENLPKGYADGIKTAFTNWQNSTENFITFNVTPHEAGAKIFIEVTDKPAGDCNNEGDFLKNVVITNKLEKAEIKISKTACDGKELTPVDLYARLQHHIGHIMGLEAHSSRPTDVMYEKPSYQNLNISSNDANTMMLLYKFMPNVSSKAYTSAEKAKLLRFSQIKGKTQNEINEYIEENLPKENAKADPVAEAVNEGMKYYEQGEYLKAATAFSKAIPEAESNSDKAYLYRCTSLSYLKTRSRNVDAYSNASQAYNVAPSPMNRYLLAYIRYTTGNETEALDHLRALLKEYPKLRCAYSLAGQIYQKNARKAELRELAKQAKEQFYENLPVIYNEPEEPNNVKRNEFNTPITAPPAEQPDGQPENAEQPAQ